MSGNKDVVWEHGENLAPGWSCNYCHIQKSGGGCTRLKEHLAGRGTDVVHCRRVPPHVREYFQRDLDKIKKATKDRARHRLDRERAAAEGNHPLGEDEYEAQMQEALNQSRTEYEYQQNVQQRGGIYERGGGSGGGGGGARGGNPLTRMFSRVGSRREAPVDVEDYQVAAGASRGMHQPRIDTGSWTQKGKNAKEAIGKAWGKFFHYAGIISVCKRISTWLHNHSQLNHMMRKARNDDEDFIDRFAEVSFYDRTNPVREWMEYGRSNRPPVLDEDSDEVDVPLPSRLVSDQINPDDLRAATGDDCISDWARRNVGQTHLGKRKMHMSPQRGCGKRRQVNSDSETEEEEYQSQDSSSGDDTSDDDGSDGGGDGSDGGGGGGGNVGDAAGSGAGPSGDIGGSSYVGVRFTGETDFTHATQDRDHGQPTSQRTAHAPIDYDTPQYSSSSYSDTSHSTYSYPIPNMATQTQTRWVYEWQDPQFYNMLVQEWETTAAWTGQTWQDYKASLLQQQGISLMSIAEYEEACQNGVYPYILGREM